MTTWWQTGKSKGHPRYCCKSYTTPPPPISLPLLWTLALSALVFFPLYIPLQGILKHSSSAFPLLHSINNFVRWLRYAEFSKHVLFSLPLIVHTLELLGQFTAEGGSEGSNHD
jgi:hypothetical protein